LGRAQVKGRQLVEAAVSDQLDRDTLLSIGVGIQGVIASATRQR
jgi:hypothetical protein